jgi:hypothetical protein
MGGATTHRNCHQLTGKPRHMPGALLLAIVASQAGNTNTSCTLPSAQLPWAYVTPGCSAGKDIKGKGGPDKSGPQSGGCQVACVAGYQQGPSGTYDVGCSCAQHPCEIVMPKPHCVACPAGTWSDKPGVPKCTACPGAPATTTASPGASAITDCLCDQGYTGQIKSPSDECTACPAGSYKGEVGPSPKICKPCPDPEATTTLVIAPTAITDCVCDKGYVGTISGKPGDACKPCDSGTYKSVAGNQQCTPCPALSTTDGVTTCKDIKACRCIPGYSGTINSPADMCTACAQGQYRGDSHGGSGGNSGATCQTCPGGATTAALGSTSLNDCLCPAGTSGVIAADMPTRCQPCAQGSYKEKSGPSACTPCPAETDTDGTGTDDGAECLQALSPTDTIIISAALSATLLGVCVQTDSPSPSLPNPLPLSSPCLTANDDDDDDDDDGNDDTSVPLCLAGICAGTPPTAPTAPVRATSRRACRDALPCSEQRQRSSQVAAKSNARTAARRGRRAAAASAAAACATAPPSPISRRH